MTANDDAFLKLQETIDSWTEQVTQTRSVLTKSLSDSRPSSRPAFRLVEPPPAVPPPVTEKPPRPPDRQALQELVEANEALRGRLEELEARAGKADLRVTDAERERIRLESELEFAREQLHFLNASSSETASRQAEYEMGVEESVQALAQSDIEIADLQKRLRSKDWRLLKARNELDMLREEPARAGEDSDLQRSRLGSLRIELEKRRVSEAEARGDARELQERFSESERKVEKLNSELESLWKAVNEGSEELRASRYEIARLTAEAGQREAAREELTQLRKSYDDATASETTLRDEVKELERRVADRELALEKAWTGLAGAGERIEVEEEEKSAMEARIEQLDRALEGKTEALDEKELALETLQDRSKGHTLVAQALREELASARERLELDALDQTSLGRALKEELEVLRRVAIEKDFVIHHAQEESRSLSRREAEMDDQFQEVRGLSERIEAEAAEAAEARQALEDELRDLILRAEEKDAAIRGLRSELAALQERAQRLEEAGPAT